MCRQSVTGGLASRLCGTKRLSMAGRRKGLVCAYHSGKSSERIVFPSERNCNLENNECINGTRASAVGSEVCSGDPFLVAGEARRLEAAAGVFARF